MQRTFITVAVYLSINIPLAVCHETISISERLLNRLIITASQFFRLKKKRLMVKSSTTKEQFSVTRLILTIFSTHSVLFAFRVYNFRRVMIYNPTERMDSSQGFFLSHLRKFFFIYWFAYYGPKSTSGFL